MPIDDRFERRHMDILGPLTTAEDGSKYILILVDSFTRWPEAFPMKTQEVTEIASFLLKEIFTRYGAPRRLISDRGRNFMSKVVTAMCDLFNITRHHTSAYHPQTNAACERMNSTIAQGLRAYCTKEQTNWPDVLPGKLMSYRKTPATQSTHLSPYFMLFGREMQGPLETSFKPTQTLPASTKNYLKQMLDNLQLAKTVATENIKNSQERSKTYYDRNAKQPKFQLGDSVLLKNIKVPKGKSRKILKDVDGPY